MLDHVLPKLERAVPSDSFLIALYRAGFDEHFARLASNTQGVTLQKIGQVRSSDSLTMGLRASGRAPRISFIVYLMNSPTFSTTLSH